jgi:hypothetical protein
VNLLKKSNTLQGFIYLLKTGFWEMLILPVRWVDIYLRKTGLWKMLILPVRWVDIVIVPQAILCVCHPRIMWIIHNRRMCAIDVEKMRTPMINWNLKPCVQFQDQSQWMCSVTITIRWIVSVPAERVQMK